MFDYYTRQRIANSLLGYVAVGVVLFLILLVTLI